MTIAQYLYLIPLLPLLAFIINLLFGRYIGKNAHWIASPAVFASLVLSVLAFLEINANGEPIVVRASKKPISTLAARGPSVNMATKAPQPAAYERSDVCAVPAASVIVENVVAFEIASAIVMKLNPRMSSLILSEMEAEKAAVLTGIIASASDPNTSKDPS